MLRCRKGLLGLLLAVLAAAAFAEDFEHGMPKDWQPAGEWQVVPEPGNPANHVLRARLEGKGANLRLGTAQMRDYRLSARFKFLDFQGQYFHVKFACRDKDPKSSCYLNVRNNAAVIIRHSGEEFTPLAEIGAEKLRPDRWYRVEFSCAGPVLSGSVADTTSGATVAEGRAYENTLQAGAAALMVALPEGASGVFLFDDIEVAPLKEAEAMTNAKHILENETLQLEFAEAFGEWSLTDRRTGRTWHSSLQAASPPQIQKAERAADGKRLDLRMDTTAGPAQATFELQGAEVLVSIKPAGEGKYLPVVFPAPIQPSKEAELVLPIDEGMILPASGAVMPPRLEGTYSHQQGGLLMPWWGVVEGEAGVMAMLETPDDWQLDLRKIAEAGVLAPALRWLPSKTGLRYERRARLCVFDKGGYVAMAKRYRRFLMDTGRFRTIEEKAKEIPNVRKLIGAIDIHDQSKDDAFLDWMIQKGIKRALYDVPGIPKERARKALDAGYVVGRYDIYTDVAGPELLERWGPPKDDLDCRRIGYPDEVIIDRDGKPRPGFGYPFGAKGGVDPKGAGGTRIPCYVRCSACRLPWMEKLIPPQIEASNYTARFIDVETAHQPMECYSDKHPLTRSEDIQTRLKAYDYLRSLGQVCASEGGADWAAHALHYQEGSLTLTRFAGLSGIYVGTAPFSLPDQYIRWQFDPAIRVPLHELVHHDQQWMTWRWNHTPNRWDKRQYWDDWDLIHVLNAQMPIFIVKSDGLNDYGERLLKTYRDVCGVLEKVGGVEMTDHQFLTQDRTVQESRFANGWRVIVNFGADAPYVRPGADPVAPKSFIAERSS